MKYITPTHMIGFNDELQKEAANVMGFLRSAKELMSGNAARSAAGLVNEFKGQYGKQMLGGMGLGAAGGAAIADPEEGARGRILGALKGGALGGGLAGAKILATGEGRRRAAAGLSRFGQRQRYTLTGKGLGKTPAQKLKKAREIGIVRPAHDPAKFKAEDYMKTPWATSEQRAAKAALADKAQVATKEEAFRKGLMSIPGVAQGMLTHPGQTLKSSWKRADPFTKAFAGYGVYETGKGLVEKPQEGGPGRLEKGLRGAGSAAGWLLAPTTLLGGQILGMGGGSVGGKIGRLGDAAVGAMRRPRQAAPGAVTPRGEH